MSTRRQFLVDCSAAALAVVVAPVGLAASIEDAEVPGRELSFAAFERELGSNFAVQLDGQATVYLELIRAERYHPSHLEAADSVDAANERFSLLFRGARACPLRQETYQFTHPEFGRFEIFIVPIGPFDQSHRCYEAIFNRPARLRLAVLAA